jgi:uncharacterized protein (UPF0335 family)
MLEVPNLTEVQKTDVKNCINELSVLLSKQEMLKEQAKAIYDTLKDSYQVDKKLARKILKAYHKRSYEEDVAEFQAFDELYGKVIGNVE